MTESTHYTLVGLAIVVAAGGLCTLSVAVPILVVRLVRRGRRR